MINPNDKVPFDDSSNSEAEDQQSQKDIHSNGLEEENKEEIHVNKDLLKEAYDASESSFTLNIDEEPQPKKPKKD